MYYRKHGERGETHAIVGGAWVSTRVVKILVRTLSVALKPVLDCKSFRPSMVVMIKWPVSSHEPYPSELSSFCHSYSSINPGHLPLSVQDSEGQRADKVTHQRIHQGLDSRGHWQTIIQRRNSDKARARARNHGQENDGNEPVALVHEPGAVGEEGKAGHAGAGDHDVVDAVPFWISMRRADTGQCKGKG